MKIETLLASLDEKCKSTFGCEIAEATKIQLYEVLCTHVREIMSKKNADFAKRSYKTEAKKVYYMSMEFLVGTSLKNNLYNLGMEKMCKEALRTIGTDIEEIYSIEPDAGLGNGGLGRLASCYMDAMTGMGIDATGYSIRYEFGIFRQKIIDGWQMEFPDDWLTRGDVWLKSHPDEAVEVHFGGTVNEWSDESGYHFSHTDFSTVVAVPCDMLISGYNTDAVNKLVLWSAKSKNRFDMNAFSRGDYAKAIEENTKAEVISKVLYPADDHMEGKILRIRQQYFFVSASLQTITKKHYMRYKSFDSLPDKVSIHINDTHPALCVPELMRILVDDYRIEWDKAWDITTKTLSYTNHTVMAEALERWDEAMFSRELPRIHKIVCEINRRLLPKLWDFYPGDRAKIEYMAPVANGEVRMANLCLAACHSINGVSALHTEILTQSIFADYWRMKPERFKNVTNGIAYRRWLCQANPLLTHFLSDLIGDDFLKSAAHLEKLLEFSRDTSVLDSLFDIKRKNKLILCDMVIDKNAIKLDPDSIFDVQIKRLHEYKRQLLNVLGILDMYLEIKTNPHCNLVPHTFIFASKASAGYYMAKEIIRLICAVANTVNSDPQVRDRLRVVFMEDYRVSLAERIIPAAEISEQISVAGKEASGTGNMKLMLNGAVTLGTLDGANVEITNLVGADNIFLFGLNAAQAQTIREQGYSPVATVNSNPRLKEIVDMLTSGVLGARFDAIANSLMTNSLGVADTYLITADFDHYTKTRSKISKTYADKYKFMKMSLVNIAKSGFFSADRAIGEYAEKIWGLNNENTL